MLIDASILLHLIFSIRPSEPGGLQNVLKALAAYAISPELSPEDRQQVLRAQAVEGPAGREDRGEVAGPHLAQDGDENLVGGGGRYCQASRGPSLEAGHRFDYNAKNRGLAADRLPP